MTDKGQESPKPGRAEIRYSEFTKHSLRQSAGFAINSFAGLYSSPDMQRKIGVELSDDQLRLASYLREIYSQAFTTLPEVELNAVRSGYGAISSSVLEIVPYHLKRPKDPEEAPIVWGETEMREDPTGVLLIGNQLQEMKKKASESKQLSAGKEDKVSVLYAAIDELVQNIPTSQDEVSEEDSFFEIIRKRFNPNPQESARSAERFKVYQETGLVEDEKGELVPYDQLRVTGAEMAFDQYKRAIDFYLNKWGNKS